MCNLAPPARARLCFVSSAILLSFGTLRNSRLFQATTLTARARRAKPSFMDSTVAVEKLSLRVLS